MKKIQLFIMIISFFGCLSAQDIQLPKPSTSGTVSLTEALMKRESHREFSPKQLPLQMVSDLLWSANGINRENGRKTAPSARNCQEIEIYLFMQQGVFIYDAKQNSLRQVMKDDFRDKVGAQPFVSDAPVVLVYVANYDKMKEMSEEAIALYGATDCGNVSQNVYLFCAARQLNTVAIGSIHRPEIVKLLGCNGKAVLAQPVGFPK